MKAQQLKRWTSSLALQVSPCLTLGLLLVASLGARAAGLPCDLSACLQRASSQAQHSATFLCGTDGLERLQLHGTAPTAIEASAPELLPPAGVLADTSFLQTRANSQFITAAQPRAP
jgi:hypothetical protein